jgi:hypothetical protein
MVIESLSDPVDPWVGYIPTIVPRSHHAVCTGDACTALGGGAFCPVFSWWLEVQWLPSVRRAT